MSTVENDQEMKSTKAVGIQKATQIDSGENIAPGKMRVIKRNGEVVAFDATKIAIAMTKAFLAVEGQSDNFKCQYEIILGVYRSFGQKRCKNFYASNLIKLAIIKGLKCLLVKSKISSFKRRIRCSPNLFGCIRNKLMPKNDGKTDSVVYESNYFFNFLYPNCRNHFYGEPKNLIRN